MVVPEPGQHPWETCVRLSQICTLTLALLSCAFTVSCIGIPDANPPVKPVSPCEIPVWVDGQFKGCVSRKQFRKVLGE
jgi:hypothetical protein